MGISQCVVYVRTKVVACVTNIILVGLSVGSIGIDYRGGDWKQSRNTLRARGLCEVVVFTPQKVSQGVDFFDSCTKISLQLCEGNCQIYARTINRFPDEQRLCFYFYFPP